MLTAGIPANGEDNRDFRPGPARGGRAVRRLRRPRLPWLLAVRCKRYNLEVLATVYRGAGRRPVLRQQEPRQDIRVRGRGTGQWSGVTPERCQDLPQGRIPVDRRRAVSLMFGWK